MAVTLGLIFQSLLLICNALTVLHPERFLSKVGLGEQEAAMAGGMKHRVSTLLAALRLVLQPALIIANAVTIVVLLLVG
ncbi:hypothetical protein NDN08_006796 [Rhodosorus marinus]|uniref:Yos1-like protein n=1 Tax=Rhodosorus marinus TaxID=101924 RepID=A0AAV8UIQ7_9RHOD|nr:hypothetical protein NDN08_006796 [Rhodosorus marinus]